MEASKRGTWPRARRASQGEVMIKLRPKVMRKRKQGWGWKKEDSGRRSSRWKGKVREVWSVLREKRNGKRHRGQAGLGLASHLRSRLSLEGTGRGSKRGKEAEQQPNLCFRKVPLAFCGEGRRQQECRPKKKCPQQRKRHWGWRKPEDSRDSSEAGKLGLHDMDSVQETRAGNQAIMPPRFLALPTERYSSGDTNTLEGQWVWCRGEAGAYTSKGWILGETFRCSWPGGLTQDPDGHFHLRDGHRKNLWRDPRWSGQEGEAETGECKSGRPHRRANRIRNGQSCHTAEVRTEEKVIRCGRGKTWLANAIWRLALGSDESEGRNQDQSGSRSKWKWGAWRGESGGEGQDSGCLQSPKGFHYSEKDLRLSSHITVAILMQRIRWFFPRKWRNRDPNTCFLTFKMSHPGSNTRNLLIWKQVLWAFCPLSDCIRELETEGETAVKTERQLSRPWDMHGTDDGWELPSLKAFQILTPTLKHKEI